jgi:catechol 2,3-dioxygenase-like lactoylglutathione lyase family enzyme
MFCKFISVIFIKYVILLKDKLLFVEVTYMKFNKLIPELAVFDINETKDFYINILGFKLEYERVDENFVFLSFEDSQFMFEEIHEEGWNIGELTYPLGRGINFSIEVKDINKLYGEIKSHNITLYRELMVNNYQAENETIEQKEFLIQDPNGYLLRFTN